MVAISEARTILKRIDKDLSDAKDMIMKILENNGGTVRFDIENEDSQDIMATVTNIMGEEIRIWIATVFMNEGEIMAKEVGNPGKEYVIPEDSYYVILRELIRYI